ncbi:MAG TPA: diacylglycerol kinase family protein [Puia sp.]|jgi:diacylglycerol kinase (ATP)|nr:diacylglycerol kinase family protein [Puia sp.]
MDPRKIIYLINPISGTRGKTSLQELIVRETGKKGIAFRILPTDVAGNYTYLLSLIKDEAVTDIVVCGGDGTVSAVSAALQGTGVRIGIIPMGSGNGLAFAAKIPKDPKRALDIVFAGKSSFIDAFLINGELSCMLCGIGLDGSVAHEFALQSRRGLQTYIRVTMKNFFTAQPYPFRIHIPSGDGDREWSFPVEAFFINIANGDQFGNHFTIAPKARLDDGLLDIVIVRKTGKWRMLLSVLRQVLGGNTVDEMTGSGGMRDVGASKKKILYFQVPGLVIGNPGAAPLHIDGDPKPTAEEFRIEVVREAINLIQP